LDTEVALFINRGEFHACHDNVGLRQGTTSSILNDGVDLCSLLPSTEIVVAAHSFFGLRKDTGAQASGTKRNKEAAAAMPLFPVRRRTAVTGAPLLQPQQGDHETRAW
jgi:hypothetical protein